MDYDSLLVTINSGDGYWIPRVMQPYELARWLKAGAANQSDEQIRVWDIDADGEPHECGLDVASTGYGDDDYARVSVRVLRHDTKELIASC